ncbi:MAG: sialate O-acetylesterase [Muribaculaceae bacterium]|nr:sialate O-acetylesterase [Muribaculaceae bacterium]
MKLIKKLLCSAAAIASTISMLAAPDPNFHIYLCLGQSNMEGNAQIEPLDRQNVPERFQMMACVDFNNPKRTQGEWYVAAPPLVREYTGLTPMDYFGRTMVDNLPEDVRVGVVAVAIGGCKIEHLDKNFDSKTLAGEADWFKNFMASYDNAPYDRLVQCAKKAQNDGVIKGILLHQGESNTGDPQWWNKVHKVYDDLLSDLGLEANSIPLFAGEVVTSEQGGVCGSMNAIISNVPKDFPMAHAVSAANLPQKGDGLHFTAHGYRVLGCRYATEMLATMGITDPKVAYSEEIPFVPTPQPAEGDFVFDFKYFDPTIFADGTFDPATGVFKGGQWGFGGWEYTKPIDLSGYKYLVAELNDDDKDHVEFRVFDTASYWEIPYSSAFNGGKLIVAELNGMMKNLPTGIEPLNTANVHRVGFWCHGQNPTYIKQVFATNNNPYETGVKTMADRADDNAVYDMTGVKVAENLLSANLYPGIYLSGGRKIAIK